MAVKCEISPRMTIRHSGTCGTKAITCRLTPDACNLGSINGLCPRAAGLKATPAARAVRTRLGRYVFMARRFDKNRGAVILNLFSESTFLTHIKNLCLDRSVQSARRG